jgi:hypothetical protein
MSRDNYWFGFTCGFMLGALLLTAFAIYMRDRGRDECNNKLPRAEKCVQVWVPEHVTHQGDYDDITKGGHHEDAVKQRLE